MIADFGCGDAKLSSSVPNKVHSFDLVAVNDKVTACDMRKVCIYVKRSNPSSEIPCQDNRLLRIRKITKGQIENGSRKVSN